MKDDATSYTSPYETWPDGALTSVDGLLLGAACELLGNVVKHAHARRASLTLRLDDDHATLVVTDDASVSQRLPRVPPTATSDCTRRSCGSKPPVAP